MPVDRIVHVVNNRIAVRIAVQRFYKSCGVFFLFRNSVKKPVHSRRGSDFFPVQCCKIFSGCAAGYFPDQPAVGAGMILLSGSRRICGCHFGKTGTHKLPIGIFFRIAEFRFLHHSHTVGKHVPESGFFLAVAGVFRPDVTDIHIVTENAFFHQTVNYSGSDCLTGRINRKNGILIDFFRFRPVGPSGICVDGEFSVNIKRRLTSAFGSLLDQ